MRWGKSGVTPTYKPTATTDSTDLIGEEVIVVKNGEVVIPADAPPISGTVVNTASYSVANRDWRSVKPRSNPEAIAKAERIADAQILMHEDAMRAAGWSLQAKLGSHLSVWSRGEDYQMVTVVGPEEL